MPWVILVLICANFWVQAKSKEMVDQRRANLLLSSQGAVQDPSQAQWDISAGEQISTYWPYVPDASKVRLVVVSGMSQMYVINNGKPGDKIISQLMDTALRPDGVRVWGEVAPNLCNEEALLQMVSFCHDPRTTPAVFIYALCFDKFRDVDLRPGYQDFLRSRPDLIAAYQQTAAQFASTYPLASEKMRNSLSDLKQASSATDHSLDGRIRDGLGEWVPMIRARVDINFAFRFWLEDLRNAVLNITPTSKRPVIRSRYEMNQQFLAMMCDIARQHHVQMILYVVPLNQQAQNPYVPEEYAQFKVWAEKFCQDRGIPYANFENIVPNDEWGTFMGGPDFKHFGEEGHVRTAAAVMKTFRPWLLGETQSSRVQVDP